MKSISLQNNLRSDLVVSPLWCLEVVMWICAFRIIAKLWKHCIAGWFLEAQQPNLKVFKSSFNRSLKNCVSCTRLRILLNTICRKPGFNSLRTPPNHGGEQASNETLKQTQQRNWSKCFPGRANCTKRTLCSIALQDRKHNATAAGRTQGHIYKDCKIAGATTWQGQGNHAFTTILPAKFRVRYDKRSWGHKKTLMRHIISNDQGADEF